MTAGTWYVDASRVAVNWGTAVSGGAAAINIFRLVVDASGLHETTYLWREAGAAATAADVADAQAATTGGAVPAPLLPGSPVAPGGQPLGTALVGDGAVTLAKLSAGVQTSIGKADGSAQKTSNLSDLAAASTARTNLGLGTAATQSAAAFDAAGAAAAAQTASAQKTSNLSDLASASTARTNLGLGTAATLASSAVAQTANNLSDLAAASTARTNLGLGTAATMTPASLAADAALTGTFVPLTAHRYPDGTTQATVVPRAKVKDPRDYGVVMDCATDSPTLTANTAAFQAFITDIVTNGLSGEMPAGQIRINAQINFSCRPGWSLKGAGCETTRIVQYADNTPVLNLGSDTVSFMHTFSLLDFTLDYANTQSAANTTANPLLFSQMAYNGVIRNIHFGKGSYAIRVASGIGCPWGTTWDDLWFDSQLTLGAMDWSAGINGTPNNHFGRFTIQCNNMTGIAMRVRGYNFTIDTLEFLANNNGVQLLELADGSRVQIGTVKLEIGTFTSSNTIFQFLGSSYVTIGHVNIGGTTLAATPASGTLALLGIGSGGGAGRLNVGCITASASAQSGNTVLLGGSDPSRINVDQVVTSGGWQLTNNTSASTSEITNVATWNNGLISTDKGDADYTVTLGDPTRICYQTTLTANRTVTLPDVGNNLHNGLTYEIIVNGALTAGATALVIKGGSTTLRTQTRDSALIRCVWRRNATPSSGWVITSHLLSDVLGPAPRAAGKSGVYYISWGGPTTTKTLVDGAEQAVPLFWGGSNVDRIGVEITTLAASTNIRLGIRRDLAGYPDALIRDAGTVDASTTGVKEITIAQSLPPGNYWLTCTAQGGTPAIRGSNGTSGTSSFLGNTSASGILTGNFTGYYQLSVSGALGASFSATGDGSVSPRLFVRGA